MPTTPILITTDDYLALFSQMNASNQHYVLKEIMTLSLESSQRGDLSLLDDILLQTNPSDVEPLISVSLLRGTFSLKQHLQNWMTFRDNVKDDLTNRKMDPQRLMRGLLIDDGYKMNESMAELLNVHHTLR